MTSLALTSRAILLVATLLAVVGFQNCSSNQFQVTETESIDQNSQATPVCNPGETRSGYTMSSVLFPLTCGLQITATCIRGQWDRKEILHPTCLQQCLHPDTKAAVDAGSVYYTYRIASGATQQACELEKVTSRCDQRTGTFLPAPEAQRSCLVIGQTCAYTTGDNIANPTGNNQGATVTGFATSTATYPQICGTRLTRSCQANGTWSGAVPLYATCQQKCVHPDTQQPVNPGAAYTYYTRASGTQAECDSAKTVSSCAESTGLFAPIVSNVRFAVCTVILPTPTPTPPPTPTPVFTPGPSEKLTFQATTAEYPNPERGFHKYVGDLATVTESTLQGFYNQGHRLAFSYVRLDSYINSDLPQSYLDNLHVRLGYLRNKGLKLVIRFAYNNPGNDYLSAKDAPLAIVQRHLQQLSPVLTDNADIIAVMQGGFIGAWGEWHASSNNLTSDANKAAVRDALLAALPPSVPIVVRYPPDVMKWYPTVLTEAQAYSGSPQSRIGNHNDCWMASPTDVGTYSSNATTATAQKNYIKALGKYTPWGGETCNGDNNRLSCSSILSEGPDFNLAYLNIDYYEGFINTWKSEGCFAEVSRRMGYRIQLDSISLPPTANKGDTAMLTVELRNLGWARMISARKLALVLRHKTSGALINGSTSKDLRLQLAPRMTTSTAVTLSVQIPTNATSGDYEVLLSLPDNNAKIATDVRYAARFANADDATKNQGWDATRGAFRAGLLRVP